MDAWGGYWSEVGNETYLAAKELCEISPRVRGFFERFITARDVSHLLEEYGPNVKVDRWELDWNAAAAQIDNDGMSSTENRLAHIVASLTAYDDPEEKKPHPVYMTELGYLGSWERDVWSILVNWATDGRLTVV